MLLEIATFIKVNTKLETEISQECLQQRDKCWNLCKGYSVRPDGHVHYSRNYVRCKSKSLPKYML